MTINDFSASIEFDKIMDFWVIILTPLVENDDYFTIVNRDMESIGCYELQELVYYTHLFQDKNELIDKLVEIGFNKESIK
jgi:hypothetical protein